jgi:PAS domain-containing protein
MRNAVSDGLARRIDALKSNICVVDPSGLIVASNQAWKTFAARNSAVGAPSTDYVGVNYLDTCRKSVGPNSAEAADLLEGLRAVLQGEQDIFEIEYPCHSPKERRWFRACVTPLWSSSRIENENIGAIVSHANITDRKRAETEYARLTAEWTPAAGS